MPRSTLDNLPIPTSPIDDSRGRAPAGRPSFWQQRHPSPGFAALDSDVDDVEVCVIGGGVSGCSTAWEVARAGADVRLLEAREVAGGASGRNGGFLLAGLHLRYAALHERVGADRARALYGVTLEGRERLLSTAASLELGDAARRTGSLRLAVDTGEVDDLDVEQALLRSAGFAVERLTAAELPAPLDAHFLGGLHFPDDGAIVPAAWVRGLAAAAAAAGATLHEHSAVVAIERDAAATAGSGASRLLVRTAGGHLVRARTVVACTEAYLPGLLPALRGRITPYRSQVLATAPPPGGARVLPCPTWSRRGWDYAQQIADGHVVIGGEQIEDTARYATWDEQVDDDDQAMLEQWVQRVLGYHPLVVARWAGVLATSFDGLPIIGELPGEPGLFVVGGWGGAGNVLGFVGGGLVAGLLGGRDEVPREFAAARLA